LALLQGCSQQEAIREEASSSTEKVSANDPINNRWPEHLAANGTPKSWEDSRQMSLKYKEQKERERKAEITRAHQILVAPYKQYPKDMSLPQPPKTEVFMARNSEAWKSRKSSLVILTSKEPLESLTSFYEKKFVDDNWKLMHAEGNLAYSTSVLVKGKDQLKITIYAELYPGERVIHLETTPVGAKAKGPV
jgi:hypothetical protein